MESNPNQQTNQSVKTAEFTDKSKSNKPLIVTTAITSILALAGIATGVYFFIDSNNKTTEISNLNAKVATLNSQINSNQPTATPESTDIEEQTDVTASLVNAKNYGFASENFIGDAVVKYSELTQEYTSIASVSTRTEFGAKFLLQADGVVRMQITGDACKYYDNTYMNGQYYSNTCVDGYFEKDITSLIPGRVVDISSMQFGNGGTSWVFFVLEDGTASYLWEYDALSDKPASAIENSQNMIHLFANYLQDNRGKIHKISLLYTEDNGQYHFKVGN